MKFIDNECLNPTYNLALEEYVLKKLDSGRDYFILWRNEPSIIVGRHQNTLGEINIDYVKEQGIHVVRRISGGGAVYHDLGNLNFTFILKDVNNISTDFKALTLPVIRALGELGVNAEVSGRNDITIDGKKISGNAQHISGNRLLHHGTLLFKSNLDVLQRALNVDEEKFKSKGIKSVRNRITNICDYIGNKIDIVQFKDLLKGYIFDEIIKGYGDYKLTDEDIKGINQLKRDKYSQWEWNFGMSPSFNLKKSKRFQGGKIEVLLDVKQGIINNCKIYGDFLALTDVKDLEQGIKGTRYGKDEVARFLSNHNLSKYFGSISQEEILSSFF